MRVPCIVRWPGQVPAGTQGDAITSTIDLLPTLAAFAGGKPPSDRVIDGKDIGGLLRNPKGASSPHDGFFYYFKDQLQAVRSGRFKLHLPRKEKKNDLPLRLYDLTVDIAESTNVAADHPKVVARLTALAERARGDLGDRGRRGAGQRPAGIMEDPLPLTQELPPR